MRCAICQALVLDPVTSTCGHSACFCCLEALVTAAAAAAAAPQCPTCRALLPGTSKTWAVNKAMVSIMAMNAGPAFREREALLKLHDALRAGAPKDALAVLQAGGAPLDLSRPLRLATGAVYPLLNYALARAAEAPWAALAEELLRCGAGVDEGSGALEACPEGLPGLRLVALVLDKGAKKCTTRALLHVARSVHPATSGRPADRSQGVDALLLRMLALLPASKFTYAVTAQALGCCIKFGHSRAALAMMAKGVQPADPISAL